MIDGLYELSYQIYLMFIEMSPYIVLGLLFVAILNVFITKEWVMKHLGKNRLASVVKASLLGVPLPLCSCGVIPTAVFMANNKSSKGAVVSFLVSTPQTGIDSIIATYGMLGPFFAIYRPIAAFIMGIVSGFITLIFDKKTMIEKNNPKNIVFNQLQTIPSKKVLDLRSKIRTSIRYAFIDFVDDIYIQFILGVIISGMISYFIPPNYFAELGFGSGLIAMIGLIIISIPMYICATASIPIAIALIAKGFSPGVAFVLLSAGPATNIASFAILSKSLGKKITFTYLACIAILSILFGYLLDYLIKVMNIDLSQYIMIGHNHNHQESSIIPIEIIYILSGIFALMLLSSFYRTKIRPKLHNRSPKKVNDGFNTHLYVQGMTCNHCVASVSNAIETIDGVTDYKVDLANGNVKINGNFSLDKLKIAIEKAGYTVKI